MQKNSSKIYQRASFIILAIIISSLLNVCMFAFQAKAAQPAPAPKLKFAYDNSGNCVAQPGPLPAQAINYPAAPMPECCLAQNRDFDAVVNVANDKAAPILTGPIIIQADATNFENNYTYNTSRLIYPPPEALVLASTVIRE